MKQATVTAAAECDAIHKKPIVLSEFIREGRRCAACYEITAENIDVLYINNDGTAHKRLNPEIGKKMTDAAVPSFKKSKCTVHIHCGTPVQKEDGKVFRRAYRSYFESVITAEKLVLRHTFFKALIAAVCALPLFAVVFFVPTLFKTFSAAAGMLIDIVKVCSWMLMWQAMAYVTFGAAESMERIRKMQSFSDAEIIFENRDI